MGVWPQPCIVTSPPACADHYAPQWGIPSGVFSRHTSLSCHLQLSWSAGCQPPLFSSGSSPASARVSLPCTGAEKLSRGRTLGAILVLTPFPPKITYHLGIAILLCLRSTVLKIVASCPLSGFGYFKQDGNSDACFRPGWKRGAGVLEGEGRAAEASAVSAEGSSLF